jgi:aryl-alcohol dehydrogenase-like predicted oxidoreductase
MWGGSEESESIAAIRASLDAGVNTIDTAAIYGMGYSEELVAKAIEGRPRDSVVIATKCGMRWDGPENEGSARGRRRTARERTS